MRWAYRSHLKLHWEIRAPDKAVGDFLSDQPVPDVVRGEHGQGGYEARLRNQPARLTAGLNGVIWSAVFHVVLGNHCQQ